MRPNNTTHGLFNFGVKQIEELYFKTFTRTSIKDMDSIDLLSSLNDFFEKYPNISVAQRASNIIAVTLNFLHETNPGSLVSVMRDKNIDNTTIEKRLNENGIKLISESRLKDSAAPDEKKIVNDVLDICINIIKDRIDDLKLSKDRIHTIYTEKPNSLRQFVEKYSVPRVENTK